MRIDLMKSYIKLLRDQASFLEALVKGEEPPPAPEPACPGCGNSIHDVAIYLQGGVDHYACPHCEFRGQMTECMPIQ